MFFSIAFGFFVAVASKLALFEVFLSLSPTTPLFQKSNILVLGIDSTYGHRSDTIMVLHVNPEMKSASLISIPRDTLAVLPGRGLDKINHAYAYGGVDLTQKTVEGLLNIKISHYMVVDLSGIISIIDDLGGITIDVEKRMYYADYAGGLYIDLYPGTQKLTGRQVMGYLRYRSDGGDLTRISRQQRFLNALSKEMLRRDNLLRSPKLFLTLLSHLETNLNPRETLGLSLGLKRAYELGQFKMKTLPGFDMMVDGIYYLRPDKEKMKNIVRQLISGERTS